ncbi:hypothetical protein [Halobacillus sp. B23F22_1]|uniref:hypothetical protein n=1 Tax=Halobacillus sp. B23F22_1 TaxID=3459514 RepID=UPI00373F555C
MDEYKEEQILQELREINRKLDAMTNDELEVHKEKPLLYDILKSLVIGTVIVGPVLAVLMALGGVLSAN